MRSKITGISLRYFKKGDRIYVRASQIWLILVAQVMGSKSHNQQATITYGDLAVLMGYNRNFSLALGKYLYLVGAMCEENGIPCLNYVVVNKDGHPGIGVHLGKTPKDHENEVKKIYDFDWFGLKIPSPGSFRKIYENITL
jgi:hypothetical protein